MHNYLPSLSSLQWRKGYESEKVRVERESVQVLQQKLLLLPFLAKTQCKGQSKVKELLIYLSKKKKKKEELSYLLALFLILSLFVYQLSCTLFICSLFSYSSLIYTFKVFVCMCVCARDI